MNKRIKIAMIGQKGIPSTWGGVEKHVDHLSGQLADIGFEIIVYARSYYAPKHVVRAFNAAAEKSNRRVVLLPTIQSKHFDTLIHTFFATIHAVRLNVDIYHYHSVGPSLLSFLPRLLRPHARVVTTFHSPDRLHQKWGFIARLMLTLGEWTAVTFAHQTITVSKELQEYAQTRYDSHTAYIPNGVPTSSPQKPSAIVGLFGLQKNDYLLTVARLVPHKGVHHLISAFRMLKTDKKLVIIGGSTYTDDYVAQLKQLARGDNRILFTGYQSGSIMDEFFSNCYLYVQPSESEGLSVALLEAASYGRYVVASNIPSNAEVVENDGALFSVGNVNELASTLKAALNDPTKIAQTGSQLRKRINKQYHWDTITQQTAQLYNELFSEATALNTKTVPKEA